MTTEAENELRRLEALGTLDRTCPVCAPAVRDVIARFEPDGTPTPSRMMPRHRASRGCESGRRDHCSCDTCF